MNRFLVLFLSITLLGCASSSVSTKESVSIPRTLKLNENFHAEVAPFIGDFLQPIVQKGFDIGYSEDLEAGIISIEFDPNIFHTEIKFKITQKNKVILESNASNSGWGTGIARNSALAKLASNVKNNLESELQKINLVIKDDKSPSVDLCNKLLAKEKFLIISEKISLGFETTNEFNLLLLKDKPNEDEKKLLITWAENLQNCVDQSNKIRLSSGASQEWISITNSIHSNTKIQLAQLINGNISYGDFQKERISLFEQAKTQWMNSETKRMSQQQDKEREGRQITNTVQSNMTASAGLMLQMQSNINQQQLSTTPRVNSFKPITCYRIGNAVNCY